jgi:hypothetical protein
MKNTTFIKIVLGFSIFSGFYSTIAFADDHNTSEVQQCLNQDGGQRELEDCLDQVTQSSKNLVLNNSSENYKTIEGIINKKCKAVEDQLVADGVGSGGATVIAACYANGWSEAK